MEQDSSSIESISVDKAAPSVLCRLYVCKVSAGFPSPADDYME